MKRRAIAIIAAAMMIATLMPISASAMGMRGWGVKQASTTTGYGYNYGMCGGMGYGFMWDEDGNFADRTTFESRIDEAIENGLIPSEYKDNYLNMYDYCTENGAGGLCSVRVGGGGGCGGGGQMWYYMP